MPVLLRDGPCVCRKIDSAGILACLRHDGDVTRTPHGLFGGGVTRPPAFLQTRASDTPGHPAISNTPGHFFLSYRHNTPPPHLLRTFSALSSELSELLPQSRRIGGVASFENQDPPPRLKSTSASRAWTQRAHPEKHAGCGLDQRRTGQRDGGLTSRFCLCNQTTTKAKTKPRQRDVPRACTCNSGLHLALNQPPKFLLCHTPPRVKRQQASCQRATARSASVSCGNGDANNGPAAVVF